MSNQTMGDSPPVVIKPKTHIKFRFFVLGLLVAVYVWLYLTGLAQGITNFLVGLGVLLLGVVIAFVASSLKKSTSGYPPEIQFQVDLAEAKKKIIDAESREIQAKIQELKAQLREEEKKYHVAIVEQKGILKARQMALLKAPEEDARRSLDQIKSQQVLIQQLTQKEENLRNKLAQEIQMWELVLQKEAANVKNRLDQEVKVFETKWDERRQQLEAEKQQEIGKLESRLQEEEHRREVLEEKRQLEVKRQSFCFQRNFTQFKDIEEAQKNLHEIIEIVENWQKGMDPGIDQASLDALVKDAKEALAAIEQHKHDIKAKNLLMGSLNMVNTQIKKLRDSLTTQRAAPVLTVSADPTISVFSRVNKVMFLCECCYAPVGEMTIKERRKWVRWSLLGVKVLVGLAISKGLGSVTSAIGKNLGSALGTFADGQIDGVISSVLGSAGKATSDQVTGVIEGSLRKIGDKVGDFIKESVEKKVDAIAKSVENLWKDYMDKVSLKDNTEIDDDLDTSLKTIRERLGKDPKEISEIVRLTTLYFEKHVKPGDFETAITYIDEREKTIWQAFSHAEQEEIRLMLNKTGNSDLFTTDLMLRHGLYLCSDCAKWIDGVEEMQNNPQGPQAEIDIK
nr:hypothetical protein [Candidatus Sigynarchaeota archaeon]